MGRKRPLVFVRPLDVRVYRFTGRQGIFRVPEAWCRECDLFVRAVDRAVKQSGVEASVRVLPWWTHVLGALRFGGWHPPVLVIDGRRVAQGHDVPAVERVVEALRAAEQKRRRDARAGEALA